MNGQPYSNSGSNSANRTPTPSSASYPASLSSHSSRDASPSRLPSNLNHINPDKSNYFVSHSYPQNYKSLVEISPNANSVNSVGYNNSENMNSGSNRAYNSPNSSYSSNQINTSMRPNQLQNKFITSPQQSGINFQAVSQKMPVSNSLPSQVAPASIGSKQVVSPLNLPRNDVGMVPRSSENYSQQLPSPSSNVITSSQVQQFNQVFKQEPLPSVGTNKVDPFVSNLGQGFSQLPPKSPMPLEPINSLPSTSQPFILPQGIISPLDSLPKPTSQSSYNNSFPLPSSQLPTYSMGSSSRSPYAAQTVAQSPNRNSQEEPLSSGPPRTNVLGIIPYSSEAVGTMSQSSMGITKTVTSQPMGNQILQTRQPVGGYTTSSNEGYSPTYVSQPNRILPQGGANRPPPISSNNPRIPPYSQHQQTVMPKMPHYPNQYSHPPTDSYPTSQMGQAYPNSPFPQDLTGPTQFGYSGGYYPGMNDELVNQVSNLSVTNAGYNKLWGKDTYDLLKTRDILPSGKVEPPPVRLQQEFHESNNCSPEIFRCTLTKIPETKSLLDKSRLPLGVLIHPFKDLNQLSVIQCSVIVRCRTCRTYINPFVYFVDSKHWKCNLCFRVNDLPDEFQYDPLTKSYGDPSRRPEIKSATIEFIAPSEYMVRPPQPAAYVFVIDISRLGTEGGYLQVFCETLLSQLEALPGDSRTAVAFITFDSSVHFYSLADNQSQPHQMVVVDIDDMFVPCPENLLVNLSECLGLVRDLLKELPTKYKESYDTGSALGPALQAAYKLLAATGGRITVFQSCLANSGPGILHPREDPNQRTADNITHTMLNPVTDFYKKLALDCSGQQIAVDLFILNSQFVDLASLCGVSRFSGGCVYHFPLFSTKNPQHVDSLQRTLQRYLCRKIGFESVMRLRCTAGLSIHTFHGNFFVRSTDLLSLPNVNPDAGFGMQVSIDENLNNVQSVCFQAALLYTSSKGERRIRVHTLCLPTASNLSDVLYGADQQCIVGLLAKMAVDRCHQSSLSDAREAFVNVVADMLSAFRLTQSSNPPNSLMAPSTLRLLPLYILAMLKYIAFRVGQSTRLDDRVFAMCQMKTLPLQQLIQAIYPDLYPVHNIMDYPEIMIGDETVVQPPRLHLSAERVDSNGIYLLDDGDTIIIYVGHNISPQIASALFNVPSYSSINQNICELPEVDSPESERLRSFINYLQNEKPISPTIQILRDDSKYRQKFLERLIEDKTESGHSYYEFLQRVKVLVK